MRARTFTRPGMAALAAVTLVAALGVSAQDAGVPTQASRRPLTIKIAPIDPTTDEQIKILGNSSAGPRTLNAFKVCLNNPELCRVWMPFTGGVGRTLPFRDRELLILRSVWLCGNDYTWGIHSDSARRGGFTDEEIRWITEGPKAAGWSAWDKTVLDAADQLYTDKRIADVTWQALSEKYKEPQFMDAIFVVGQYSMISMFVRSAGIQPETGRQGFPAVK
jgi:4-carboxymuconolactone decarboxylase